MDTSYKSLPLYTLLFAKTVKSSDEFINQITDPNHLFYAAARDIAREILSRTEGGRYNWLAERIDDIAKLVEVDVSKKIQKWWFKAILSNGKMPLCDPESTIKWLFKRMLSEYKNLFDRKRKNFLDLNKADWLLKLEALNKMQANFEGEVS